jgi:hypothetical protein
MEARKEMAGNRKMAGKRKTREKVVYVFALLSG